MSKKTREKLRQWFAEIESEEPEMSTLYIFERTVQRALVNGIVCDASDIAEALDPNQSYFSEP